MHCQINTPVILWLIIYNALIFVLAFLTTYVSVCIQQTKLVVVPDNMAAGLLRAVSRLLDVSVLPSEPMLRFLSHCCLSLLALLINLQTELPTETNHKRCVRPIAAILQLTLWKWPPNLALKHLSHSQGGNMGSLRVGAEHRSSPASNGPAVDAGWWSERRRAAAARTDPVHAAAACSASQPAAGQLPPAARDHTAPHGKRLTHWLKSFGTV